MKVLYILNHLKKFVTLASPYVVFSHILSQFFFFLFNWWIIAIQYHAGFCHTSTWISHRYTYGPSLLDLPPIAHLIPPSRLSQSTGLSAWCHTVNSHWLSILCRVMCMLLSPFIPPSPSPTVHKSILYVWVSITALQIGSSVPSF